MSKERNLACINIGTSAVLMLVVKQTTNDELIPINEYIAVTELADSLSVNHKLKNSNIELTNRALLEMKQLAEMDNVHKIIIVVSNLIGEALNRSTAFVQFHETLKIYPQLLSAKEESRLIFLGATHEMTENNPCLVLNIGGCNSQIICGYPNKILNSYSVRLGYMELCSQFHLDQRHFFWKTQKVQKYIHSVLSPHLREIKEWIAINNPRVIVAGGITSSLASLKEGNLITQRSEVQNIYCFNSDIKQFYRKLRGLSPEERQHYPGIDQVREVVTPAGMLLLNTLLSALSISYVSLSCNGLRMGVLQYFITGKKLGE